MTLQEKALKPKKTQTLSEPTIIGYAGIIISFLFIVSAVLALLPDLIGNLALLATQQ